MSFQFGTNTTNHNNNNNNFNTLSQGTNTTTNTNLFNTTTNINPFNTNTTETSTINTSLDANDTKEDEKKSDTNPNINDFKINENDMNNININTTNPLSLNHTHLITSDEIIPSCSTTIYWNITQISINQCRNNNATLKTTKKIIIPPSNRTFIIHFEPGSNRMGGGGFGFANAGNQRRFTTITVSEIAKNTTNSSFGYTAINNGNYNVIVHIFNPNINNTNTQNWILQTPTNPQNSAFQSTKRLQLFEMNTLNTKIFNGLFRMKIHIQIPPTIITKIIQSPENITPLKYIQYKQNNYQRKENKLLGITTNQNYNSSYEWYKLMINMLLKQTFGDITIICCDGKYWRAHKDILSNFSPVFKAMCNNPMKESLENNIELKEENSNVIKYLLIYMYTGSLPTDIDLDIIGTELLKASDKFCIDGLTVLLFDFIKTRINPKNVALALILCKLYKGSECKESVNSLNKYVLKYLAKLKNMRKVLKSKSFEVLFTQHPDLVKNILLATNSINIAGNDGNGNDVDDEIVYFNDDDSDDESDDKDD